MGTSDNKSQRSSIRTYESDAAKALRENNASIGTVFLAEQKKKVETATPIVAEEPATHNFLLFALGTLFVLLSLGGLAYAGYVYVNKEPDVTISESKHISTVIGDKEVIKIVSKQSGAELKQELKTESPNLKEPKGKTVNFIFLASSTATDQIPLKELVNKLAMRMPGKLVRSLEGTYALGLYSTSGGNEPYLSFTVNSYEQAFAGMLEWENLIFDDLNPFFEQKVSAVPEPVIATSTSTSTTAVATTSEPAENIPLKPIFADAVIKNKDVRILKRGEETLLIYLFADRQTIVVVPNEEVLREVLSRLSPERF